MAQRARGTDRILDILECLARLDRPASRAELSAQTGMPRSTVYALTDLLLKRNWIEETDSRLVLGRMAGFVSNAYLRRNGFETLAREVLSALSAATGALTEIDLVEDWVHIVAISEGHMAQGYVRPIEGARLPLMPTAAARVMLADLPDSRIRQQFPSDALQTPSGARISWDQFFDDLRRFRERGYASVAGWFDGSISTLACPVRDPAGRTIASLCMLLATRDMNARLDFHLGHLRTAALRLEDLVAGLGWPRAELGWQRLHGPDTAAAS
ncbi:IclR family transcriptional regulator [Gemmobacter nectariphilus]|uniref:IclR family transcriptional regulator n=1 Tax=Gemmobacter nectariphilus TaxID=220343 RepID=UPI000413239A|nr:helix-turn-helix domain-containing protein [Gemmobacter nectariphilus]